MPATAAGTTTSLAEMVAFRRNLAADHEVLLGITTEELLQHHGLSRTGSPLSPARACTDAYITPGTAAAAPPPARQRKAQAQGQHLSAADASIAAAAQGGGRCQAASGVGQARRRHHPAVQRLTYLEPLLGASPLTLLPAHALQCTARPQGGLQTVVRPAAVRRCGSLPWGHSPTQRCATAVPPCRLVAQGCNVAAEKAGHDPSVPDTEWSVRRTDTECLATPRCGGGSTAGSSSSSSSSSSGSGEEDCLSAGLQGRACFTALPREWLSIPYSAAVGRPLQDAEVAVPPEPCLPEGGGGGTGSSGSVRAFSFALLQEKRNLQQRQRGLGPLSGMSLRHGCLGATRAALSNYPMGHDVWAKAGEGMKQPRMFGWQNVMMVKPYIEQGMPHLYPRWYDDEQERIDHNYVLFNRPQRHAEKIGVVVESMKGTAVVACRYFVRYKNFAKVVSRVNRCWAHDEDNACVVGDVVMIRKAPRRGKYKSFVINSILEPDLEARERLKKDLPARNKPDTPLQATGWKPLFDFSRDGSVNEDETQRAEQLASDIHGTDADYDGGLADRSGKDKWAFLDADFMAEGMDYEEADIDNDPEGDPDDVDA